MKKLMIAFAVAAVAVASQAATFQWLASNNSYGIDLADLNGNTTVAAGTDTMLKNNTSLTAVLTVLSADGQSVIGTSEETAMAYGWSGSKPTTAFNVTGTFAAGQEYQYKIVVSGKQNNMANYQDDNWDYSAATIESTVTGVLVVDGSGSTQFAQDKTTSSWTVSGAVAVPEPTSGLLLLLGVAGLALRRRRA